MKKAMRFLFALCALLFVFVVPAKAAETYVEDDCGLLGSDEVAVLNAQAEQVTDTYDVDVVIRIKESNGGASDIYAYSDQLFTSEGLGYGSDRDIIMLVITLEEGNYNIFSHGSTANAAFTDYAKQQMDTAVLNMLNEGDFYSACATFIGQSGYMLEQHASGNTVDNPAVVQPQKKSKTGGILITLFAPLITAFLTVTGMKSKNKTKFVNRSASGYIVQGGVNWHTKKDLFMKREVTRKAIQSNEKAKPAGGTTVDNKGNAHQGGSFNKK